MSLRRSDGLVRLFALVVLLYASGSSLRAQTLQITSPAGGTIVNPGQVVTVTVTASSAFQEVIVVGGDPIGFSDSLASPPYQFSIHIPPEIRPQR